MKQRHLLYTELKHFHTHPVSCCLLAASHTYTRCIVQPSLQMDMSSSPEYRHRSSASASVEAKMSVLLLSSARVRLAHPRDSHAEYRATSTTGEDSVSGERRILVRLQDCLPPPRWTPRGDRGSWPGPGLGVHPGRMCL